MQVLKFSPTVGVLTCFFLVLLLDSNSGKKIVPIVPYLPQVMLSDARPDHDVPSVWTKLPCPRGTPVFRRPNPAVMKKTVLTEVGQMIRM